ncbi:MAG TPA: hypothetical protein VGO46_07950 [Gemmatimonadaceae bacterium]|jgi:hypothetical protein|nr:hypothetical protein [Gemmatimonadaceae bacterium]
MEEQMRATMFKLSMLTLLGTVFVLGCGEDSENGDGPSANCNTEVTSITSPSAGYATMHGSFFGDESVIIQETDGTVISEGTPSDHRDAFTLSGVPSGHHRYEIVISCDAGRDNLGGFDFDIQ